VKPAAVGRTRAHAAVAADPVGDAAADAAVDARGVAVGRALWLAVAGARDATDAGGDVVSATGVGTLAADPQAPTPRATRARRTTGRGERAERMGTLGSSAERPTYHARERWPDR